MAHRRGDHPNVVVFFTDQQRWDTTGVHGNPLDLTPNFDRVAQWGTHAFTACTSQPVCAPARAMLQTGQYQNVTGVFRNGIALPPDARTLAHCFNDAGYHSGYIGKWHLAAEEPVTAARRGGYRYWLGANALEMTSEPYRAVMYDDDCREVMLPGYRVDAMTDAAIRYVHAHRDEPFYLFISFLEPHHQNHLDDYPPPQGYRERYTGRWTPPDLAALGGSSQQHLGGYYGQVKRLDEAFGRLLDALESLNLSDNTIVAFTSDHGCHFKTRNAEYKRSCHESSVRIPMALRGPGFDGGGRIGAPISLIDLPPTLLEAAGIASPSAMQGQSFLSLTRGDAEGRPDEVFIQISEAQVGRAVRTRRWKYAVEAPGKHGARDAGSDRYVEAFLYDLLADPYELTNLIGLESHQEVAGIMRERLMRRMVAAGEPEPIVDTAEQRPSGQRRVSPAEARH